MRSPAASFLAVILLVLTPAFSFAEDQPAADAKGFSADQKAAIEEIIKGYLTKDHPEVVGNAMLELQSRPDLMRDIQAKQQQLAQKEQDAAMAKTEASVSAAHDRIYNNPDTPVGGNLKGTVTIVEFFDYQCPYCKMAHQAITKLMKDDKDVKFIYEEYPILGPASTTAAKAAIASVKQNKYIVYHDALMVAPFSHNQRPAEDDALVYKTAKDVGLNIDKLKKDMADPENDKLIETSLSLGKDVGVSGTPMFIINDKVFPGAMQYDALKKAVDDARASAAKKTP